MAINENDLANDLSDTYCVPFREAREAVDIYLSQLIDLDNPDVVVIGRDGSHRELSDSAITGVREAVAQAIAVGDLDWGDRDRGDE